MENKEDGTFLIKKPTPPRRSVAQTLLILGIGACLALAVDRLVRFYDEHIPLVQEGECLQVTTQRGTFKMKVVKNDPASGRAGIVIDVQIMPGYVVAQPGIVTFKELRELGAEKVDCGDAPSQPTDPSTIPSEPSDETH